MATDHREDDVNGVYSNSIVETEEVVAEEENKYFNKRSANAV